MGAGGGGAFMNAAVFQPNDPNFAMVGNDTAGPYRTTDGGLTWALVMEGLVGAQPAQVHGVSDLALDPSAPQTVYFASQGLYRTTDFGASWTQRALPTRNYRVVSIDPGDPNWVFVGERDHGNANPTWILRSPDKWETLSLAPPVCSGAAGPACKAQLPTCLTTSYKVAGTGTGAPQSPDVRDIVVDPLDANELIAATDCGLYFSHDRGGSWVSQIPAFYDVYKHLVLDGATRTLYASFDARFAKQIGVISLSDPETWEYAGAMRKSTDWGATWTSVSGANGADAVGTTGGFESSGGAGEVATGWVPFLSGAVTPASVSRDSTAGVTPYGSSALKVTPPSPPRTSRPGSRRPPR
jgi:hypothetical protein